MSPILPEGVKDNLRFAANFRLHKTYLLELDAVRFRGLGEEHTKKFVRHGMQLADRLDLNFVEEVQYLLFLMYFLGSHFHDDPRYAPLARILNRQPASEDQRISTCHAVFVDFSNRYLGDNLSEYCEALGQFNANIASVLQYTPKAEHCIEAFLDAYKMTPEERRSFPALQLINIARNVARSLELTDEKGTAVCLSLSFWLGSGFYVDPLCPWVHDVLDATGNDPDARETAMLNYAAKRMKRQLTSLGRLTVPRI